MASLNLFIVRATKQLITSLTDATPFVLPALEQGDTVSLNVTVVDQIAPFTYGVVEPSTYTLRAGLFRFSSPYTTYAYVAAASWTVDAVNHRQSCILPLNTSAIDTAVTNGDVADVIFEIEMTETTSGAITTILHVTPVSLVKDFLTNATTTVAAGETAATEAMVRNYAVPRYATEFSQRFEMDSQGNLWRIYRGEDGLEHSEQFIPP